MPGATRSLHLLKGCVYTCPIARMHETSTFIDRFWRHPMSVNLGGARVALKGTSGKVDTESAERCSIKRSLQTFLALLERSFTPTPLGEERRENQNQQSANQYQCLRSKDAVCKRNACVSEVPHAEGCRRDHRQCY